MTGDDQIQYRGRRGFTVEGTTAPKPVGAFGETSYRADQDLVRWGLHQLDGGGGFFDPPANNDVGVNTYVYQNEAGEPHLMNPLPSEVQTTIANDEAIAHVLQEELTKLAAEESDPQDTAQSSDKDSKAAVLSQDWRSYPGSTSSSYGSGITAKENEGQSYRTGEDKQNGLTTRFPPLDTEEEDTMGPRKQRFGSGSKGKTISSTPDYESFQSGDDDHNLTLALALSEEEHRFDEEVAKRLTKLDSIRHIPRINADVMPTVDAASMDHARLMERLIMYGLNERKIQGDGNCQFRALSDQLYRTPEHHKFVRKTIVTQLKAHPDVYSGYVPMPYGEYLKKMAKSGEWGDHVTLQAAADNYGLKIWLITSFKATSFIEILPDQLLTDRVIYLSFWAEVHYNSIYPEGDSSSNIELAPKKKHWLLKAIF